MQVNAEINVRLFDLSQEIHSVLGRLKTEFIYSILDVIKAQNFVKLIIFTAKVML